ncbi:MAG: biopolymer transporter ExbD [Ignavibacteriaceae bacterium]|nr:MAG: biopolymer transporter ExbD [Chlorobiota bacterium]GJQ33635.1 MAG: biopolymer transporter ExbD [Ignavibacteriaceae bacterium]
MISFAGKQKRKETKPGIPLASMPDIIFILLLFFMVSTVLKEIDVKVEYDLPEASTSEKFDNRRLNAWLFIGKDGKIQVNDMIVSLESVKEKFEIIRSRTSNVVVQMRVDKNVPMSLVETVQLELRKANCLRVNYISSQKNKDEK